MNVMTSTHSPEEQAEGNNNAARRKEPKPLFRLENAMILARSPQHPPVGETTGEDRANDDTKEAGNVGHTDDGGLEAVGWC